MHCLAGGVQLARKIQRTHAENVQRCVKRHVVNGEPEV